MPSKNIVNIAMIAASTSEDVWKMAAVLFRGGAIIRVAVNSKKFIGYRRELFEFDPTRHAEINVCHNMPREVLKSCSMLVVRVSRKRGKLTSAKPCKACMRAMQLAGISKVYFSNYDGKLIKVNPSNINIDTWEKEFSPATRLCGQ